VRLHVVRQRHFEHPQVLLGGKELARFGFNPRRDDDLGELLADFFGRRPVERPVEGEGCRRTRRSDRLRKALR
jgi:hypothetical protein